MSGHSKWATIRHKKGAADAKRGKIFTKIIKEIMVAAKMGGGDPETNAKLRTIVNKARAANMPKDNIERAIKKGIGDTDGANYVELVYEGYAPGGVAIMIEALTDNKNRTAADVRSTLTKAGGNLGETGCVAYMFNKKGIITLDGNKYSEEQVLEIVLEAGAEDVKNEGEYIEIECTPEDFESVTQALENAEIAPENSEVMLVADTTLSLDEDSTRKVLRLIETLEDNDDIQNVSTNLDIPDDFDY
ncbi:YebC/PmpR family DNA-binding transcriptional regulator [Spirochaeta lutea]|uniref:Probable transcriptional regulatory protein DC28_00035 n=1 Tax=Spirochaeta lutea TaxID=1480694 RepID=A0A098R1Y0_9SPIO|nr:YebC/PmpR family DNA-binding transcriptional regulator [Spirochaeta lutea]KGE73673.1 transcriptional regulator [Spirochaeta lutea]